MTCGILLGYSAILVSSTTTMHNINIAGNTSVIKHLYLIGHKTPSSCLLSMFLFKLVLFLLVAVPEVSLMATKNA